jgi:hypothetical protein
MIKARGIALLAVFTLVSFAAFAQEATTQAPDEKAMMEAWMKAATPGDAHKKLSPIVGTFNVKVKSWMKPGEAPAESTGTSVHTWILGNRWVDQRFEGSFMGQPFSGIGYTGYDNIRKAYVGIWMDNMSTGPMMSTGSGDEKVMTFTGTSLDPLTGQPAPFEEKITTLDNDTILMEMSGPDPTGKMFKMMEIRYERKK